MKYEPYKFNQKSELARDDFLYLPSDLVMNYTIEDWKLLDSQRSIIDVDARVKNIMSLLAIQEIKYGWGYPIDPLRHALQTATLIMEAGYEAEMIVTALIHDIGLVSCPENHGAFASTLAQQFLNEKYIWILRHHQDFIGSHELKRFANYDLVNDPRNRWIDHQFFDVTERFVDDFDQVANSEKIITAPLSFFEPILYEVIVKGLER